MMHILQDSFLRWPLIALLLAGGMCSFLAVYVVLRRVVFLGAALAEISSVGVAVGILLGEKYDIHINFVLCSLIFVLIGVGIFSIRPRKRSIPEEGVIGTGWAIASALAILFIYFSETGEVHMLDIVKGTPIGVSPQDIAVMFALFLPVALIHGLFYKEFIFISFDPETAATQGYRTRLWDLLLYLTLGVVIAASIRTVGTLLTFSYLVIPGVLGLAITKQLKPAFILSFITATISTVIGYYFSVKYDWPTSAAITATLSVFVIPTVIYRFLSRV